MRDRAREADYHAPAPLLAASMEAFAAAVFDALRATTTRVATNP